MVDAEYEMGSGCYGYGRWEAPYWFIGPEAGQSPTENNDIKLRYKAFRQLGKDGLTDCGAFHDFIHEKRWHRATRPALQPTWRRLILLLMTFLKEPTDDESLRTYQRDRLGRLSDETCVIELSGLPARNFEVPRERRRFRQQRIEFIRGKMLTCKPAFAVMYGKGAMKDWEEIAGITLCPDSVQKVGSTIVVVATHPVARGLRKKYWVDLGQRMRSVI